jgi:hypothetical protein
MTTKIIFGKRNTANCYGKMSGTLISAQTAVWFGKLELPRQTRYWYQRGRASWSAWCAQNCSATMVYMRTRSFDFECPGSQSAWESCCNPPNASNSIAFGPVMTIVQLNAKPMVLNTYIYQQNDAEPPANHSNLQQRSME